MTKKLQNVRGCIILRIRIQSIVKLCLFVSFLMLMSNLCIAQSQTGLVTVVVARANIRESPSISSKAVGRAVKSKVLRYTASVDGWYYVVSGRIRGWIHASVVKSRNTDSRDVVDVAKFDLSRVKKGNENSIPTNATRVAKSEDDEDYEKVAVKTPTPTPKPIPKIISGGVVNGKATNLVKPPYPAAARAVRASGVVNVQVTIDENGNVISASAVSGHPLLRAAAASAARLSTFSPTLLAGQPVKVTGVIVYNFQP